MSWDAPELRARASAGSGSGTVGRAAAATWLSDRGLVPPTTLRWHVEVALDVHDRPTTLDFDEKTATRFHIDIYSEEWGVFFCHAGRASWIRITDIAFVHGRDEHGLLSMVPNLPRIGGLVRRVELIHGVRFRREHALIRTNLDRAEPAIRAWVAAL